ncbi:site-specific integrase [Pseudomonas sp. 2FE]|uniref:tyrosine-type recombinase/integrase n=1 Tax=Pseudomonas sp. 2FE TaxID=2502190 RepID=UPI0010F94CC6|nr:site-specific integrase [Pseudomonas sp. 2FE]
MSKLTPKQVKDIDQPGSYQDGRGLILKVSSTLRKSWVFRYMLAKKRHDLAIGTYPALSLRDARLEADKQRLEIARGVDPAAERAKARETASARPKDTHTFQTEAEVYMTTHSKAWSAKHHQQWRNSMQKHVFPVIGSFKVSEVDTDDVLDVMRPIWSKIPVTANRIRNRIELVLDASKALKLRNGENPALWRGHLDKLLPKQPRSGDPFPSYHWPDVPELMVKLDAMDGPAARACELMIMTACRSSEVLGARWEEIDFDAMIWSIPAERMKAGKRHRVPLTQAMVDVLRQQHGKHAEWVFLNKWRSGPLPGNAIGRVLDALRIKDAVPHGFRSTFRTWSAEVTSHPREVCEMALAHTLSSKVEAAYNRGDLLDKRRALMSEWSAYLYPNQDEQAA